MLPDFVQKIAAFVPVFGDVLKMSEVQLHLFYPSLILYECCLTAVLHFWAWSSVEPWYADGSDEHEHDDPERQPLLHGFKHAEGDQEEGVAAAEATAAEA